MRNFKPRLKGRARLVHALALSFALLPLAGARADNPANAAQALLKAQGLLKQIAQQKGLLETELATARADGAAKDRQIANLKADLKAKDRSLSESAADLASSTHKNVALDSALNHSKERLTKTTEQLQEVVAKYKEKAATLRETEAARQDFEAQLQRTQRELQDSERKNLALYQANRELMDLYKNKSSWDALVQHEPLTGIKGVAIENILQEYAGKSQDQLREVNVKALERGSGNDAAPRP
ncbi:MAG: hypothetical protein HYX63_02925 [Gammaproteobacteria bacterium]|nr:hypothetical protein [Gammaproteobacteria bacterium]